MTTFLALAGIGAGLCVAIFLPFTILMSRLLQREVPARASAPDRDHVGAT